MMTPLIVTSQIEINATPENIWKVLINLHGYSDWNSKIRVVEAPESIAVGSRAKL
ncbi:hypothetical protein IQ247_02085 [Plectonema cf. radiosum LEGE 06105]|uniref:SRPBCC domain-containing protein n=1 Tax=Plectonema cf. radiosum LEGE 06105 TaxID=945769 RepID=A0A8J7EYX2_9CYAN|nr:hypothetical protein [Plectonema radiosum]MBE9211517.1 hypothetical protein [Plectonema cf. radiosum LEGE 06105]